MKKKISLLLFAVLLSSCSSKEAFINAIKNNPGDNFEGKMFISCDNNKVSGEITYDLIFSINYEVKDNILYLDENKFEIENGFHDIETLRTQSIEYLRNNFEISKDIVNEKYNNKDGVSYSFSSDVRSLEITENRKEIKINFKWEKETNLLDSVSLFGSTNNIYFSYQW